MRVFNWHFQLKKLFAHFNQVRRDRDHIICSIINGHQMATKKLIGKVCLLTNWTRSKKENANDVVEWHWSLGQNVTVKTKFPLLIKKMLFWCLRSDWKFGFNFASVLNKIALTQFSMKRLICKTKIWTSIIVAWKICFSSVL